ncbi:MAG: hypothetical protein IJS44_06455 [Clostridia bacterium]|nr:hypothetical protein [Clostridia bacterium]
MSTPMDQERLRCLCSLRREISRTKARIAKLAKKSENEQDEILLAELKNTGAALTDYLRAAEREECALITYINGIEDASVREIFMLRYVDGVRSWQKIAFMAGEYDESYVRRKHAAYLKKSAKKGSEE